MPPIEPSGPKDLLFDSEYAVHEANALFGAQLGVGADLRMFGVHLIKRCFRYVRDDFGALVAYAGFLRQVVSCYDSTLVLLGEGAVDAARITRLRFLDRYTDGKTLVLGTHFAAPTGGSIQAIGERFKLNC